MCSRGLPGKAGTCRCDSPSVYRSLVLDYACYLSNPETMRAEYLGYYTEIHELRH